MVARTKRLALWWGRASLLFRLGIVASGALIFCMLLVLQRPGVESQYPGSNLLIFVFVNLVILFLLILVYLVGRNVVKLVFERRRGILGSRLRIKLVSSFVALIFVPSVLLFIVASGLLSKAMEGWVSGATDKAIGGAVEVAKAHLALLRQRTFENGASVRGVLLEKHIRLAQITEALLDAERQKRGLYSIRILDGSGAVRTEAFNANAALEAFKEPPFNRDALARAFEGEEFALTEEQGARSFHRYYAPLQLGEDKALLVVASRIAPEIVEALENVRDSLRENRELKLAKNPLKSGYLLTLVGITGLILFSAIWAGFYIARAITVPIQKLAEGTDAVSRGNYDFQIKVKADDEIGFLVNQFNKMTSDLRKASSDAERRRLFIETILSHLAVGVIALDHRRVVTSINEAAMRVFGFRKEEGVLGAPLHEVLRPEELDQVAPLLEEIDERGSDQKDEFIDISERQLKILSQGRELTIISTAGIIAGSSGEKLGIVLLFDDVTELVKAQHMSAWREVARRIAHEIKNPLTPIQLSAQRLQRQLGEGESGTFVNECVQTIVEHVDSIKRLANEFSHFARMPTAQMRQEDLNTLIGETIAPYAESHSEVVFQFIPDDKLPEVQLDREQIRRIFINLFDNAVAAIEGEQSEVRGKGAGRISVRSEYDRKRRCAIIEIRDSGPGIQSAEKARIFEPYFTTKRGGTGLGLAIVTSILADHQGTIRVYDNEPRGAKFIVEIPLVQKSATQRRFV